MANYKIQLTQIAQDDLKSIIAHIRLNNPDAAIRMYEKIEESIGKLADFPLMGSVSLDTKIAGQGYRMIVVDTYLVFYLLVMEENTVEVHRVLHVDTPHR